MVEFLALVGLCPALRDEGRFPAPCQEEYPAQVAGARSGLGAVGFRAPTGG